MVSDTAETMKSLKSLEITCASKGLSVILCYSFVSSFIKEKAREIQMDKNVCGFCVLKNFIGWGFGIANGLESGPILTEHARF